VGRLKQRFCPGAPTYSEEPGIVRKYVEKKQRMKKKQLALQLRTVFPLSPTVRTMHASHCTNGLFKYAKIIFVRHEDNRID
jgi:hypothetical protein